MPATVIRAADLVINAVMKSLGYPETANVVVIVVGSVVLTSIFTI